MTHKDAWNELKEKLDTASKELAVMIVKNKSATESRRLSRKWESFNVVQGWMRDIEQSIGYGSYTDSTPIDPPCQTCQTC